LIIRTVGIQLTYSVDLKYSSIQLAKLGLSHGHYIEAKLSFKYII